MSAEPQVIEVEPNTEAWLEERRNGLGSRDASRHLNTTDAADEEEHVNFGGRRSEKQKKHTTR